MTRWTSTNPRVIDKISARQPKRAVSPRLSQATHPGPVEARNALTVLSRIVGSVVCSIGGHEWNRTDPDVMSVWDARSGEYRDTRRMVRRCVRCGVERTTQQRSTNRRVISE